MLLPLDGPSKSIAKSVSDSAVTEVKVGASAFNERKVVSIQPLGGHIWVYFADDGEVPTAATVSTNGFFHSKKSLKSYEATHQQAVYIVSDTGTIDVRISERA